MLNKKNFNSLLNVFIRSLSLFSRFSFIFFIGRFSFNEENLGIYGIFHSAIALIIYVLGFDFYTFTTREILRPNAKKGALIKNQFFFHLAAYVIVIPMCGLIIYYFDFVPEDFYLIFFSLLILEHLNQELYRLLVTFKKPIIANSYFFIRSGLWVWVSILSFFITNQINLKLYLFYWLLSSLLSLITSVYSLSKLVEDKGFTHFFPKKSLILKGIKSSVFFFFSSLAFKIIQLSDRFMIDFFHGKKITGVYTIYSSVVNSTEIIVFSAVTMIFYPKLIESYNKNKRQYKTLFNSFKKNIIIVSLILVLGFGITMPFLFSFLQKDLVNKEINTFFLLLLGGFFMAASTIPHYDLYAKKKDMHILVPAMIGMLANLVINLALIPRYGITGAGVATIISYLIILIYKSYYSKKYKI